MTIQARVLGLGCVLMSVACGIQAEDAGPEAVATEASELVAAAPVVQSAGRATALNALATRGRAAQAAAEGVQRLVDAAVAAESFDKNDPALVAATRAWFEAELLLDAELLTAWDGVRIPKAGPVVADKAQRLALLELEILVRRVVGPTLHSEVAGLATGHGCRGDVVRDGMLGAYAAAAVAPVAPGFVSGDAEADALRRISAQIACLSARQLSLFDTAMAVAFDVLARRLAQRGQGQLVPGVARAIAPVMLLLADAQKHLGESASSLRWFAANAPALRVEVRRLGWSARRTVFLYDRRTGRLRGIPECAGATAASCVDPMVLLESVLDPHSMGGGLCAFSGMVAGGVRGSGASARYTCAPVECKSAASAANPEEKAALDAIRSRWPAAFQGSSDGQMKLELCGKPSSPLSLEGTASEDCVTDLSPANPDPFDAYLACVADNVAGPSIDGSIEALRGVPMGLGCNLFDGAEGASAPATGRGGSAPSGGATATKDAVFDFLSGTWDDLTKTAAGGAQAAGGISAALGALISIEKQLLSPFGAEAELAWASAMRWLQSGRLLAEGRITTEEYFRVREMKPADAVAFMNQRAGTGAKSCSDPARCSSDCTGLSTQITKATACSSALVNDVMARAGLPPRTVPPTRDLGRVSNWGPDGRPEGGADQGPNACLGRGSRTERALSCGAVLCNDTISLAPSPTACCTGRVASATVTNRCLTTDCAAGENPSFDPATGRCTCAAVERAEPAPPVPPPGVNDPARPY